ncbi:MAG: DUF4386 domain-containing protein [Spirochaetia bacterium]|nr:DUF4386 domain-containing protein [Spirochaetia bacterium]
MIITRENIDIAGKEKNNTGKALGFLFISSLLVPALNWAFILSKFIAPENFVSTADNILADKFMFRIAILNETLTAVIIILLSIALYQILKLVNNNLALTAFVFRLIDAFLTLVIAFVHLAALQIMDNPDTFSTSSQELVKSVVGALLNNHVSLTSILGIFHGLGMLIFMYLLLKSKYIPGLLAGFGLVSYVFLFMYDLLVLVSPALLSNSILQISALGPNLLFVTIAGFWLILKGLNIQKVA